MNERAELTVKGNYSKILLFNVVACSITPITFTAINKVQGRVPFIVGWNKAIEILPAVLFFPGKEWGVDVFIHHPAYWTGYFYPVCI